MAQPTMLDLDLYDRVPLWRRPPAQAFIADYFLRFDYRKLDLVVEGLDNLPDHPVVFAMNHTDNFNYWPLQYHMHRTLGRYTATWVKGKNYEHWFVSWFMRMTNNIPLASRGYVITRDFVNTVGRRPEGDEYALLRAAVDALDPGTVDGVPTALCTTPRSILGRPFNPLEESYAQAIDATMHALHGRFIELNERAFRDQIDLLVFPQGTRTKRLSRGHVGLAQVALHLGASIVPVGCSGCDEVYPGKSIVSKKPGRVVYRIGKPMPPSTWPDAPVVAPLSREADAHRDAHQKVVDDVMDRINELVDEPYQYSQDQESQGTQDTHRFL